MSNKVLPRHECSMCKNFFTKTSADPNGDQIKNGFDFHQCPECLEKNGEPEEILKQNNTKHVVYFEGSGTGKGLPKELEGFE